MLLTILIKNLKSLLNLLLRIGILHLPRHHGQKLGEIDGPVSVSIDLVDHVLEFGFGGVLAKRPHDGAEFFGGDCAIAVFVEEGEGFFEFGDLFFG